MSAEKNRQRPERARQPLLPLAELTPAAPDLTDWDVILINTSGGKDSQTMMNEVVRRADEQNVARDRLIAAHADLGRVEWKGTAQLAEKQARMHGIEFRKIKRPQGDLLEHVERRGMWPSPAARYCTSDHKRSQIAKIITALDRERREGRTFRLLNCMGLRAEESQARRARSPHAPNTYFSTRSRTVWDWLPIHDWSEEEVWADIARSGIPHHPAYDLGMPRLSCVLCIYAPKEALMLAGRHNPELLAEYVRLEERIDHRFRPELSLAQVAEDIERGESPGEIRSWRM